jgi:hypothetical protein
MRPGVLNLAADERRPTAAGRSQKRLKHPANRLERPLQEPMQQVQLLNTGGVSLYNAAVRGEDFKT